MSDFATLMFAPFMACVVMVIVHVYLGLHVIKREVIFVDLALAQVSAFGATIGLLFGYELDSTPSFILALLFTLIGATVFTLTRSRTPVVPQEALIGIVYAIAAAAVILILSRAPDGGEELKALMVGHLLFVGWDEIAKLAILYGLISIAHYRVRERLLLVSTSPEKAYEQGIRIKAWDFFFYATFGLVVANSVQIAGVLLVFAMLIVPSVCGAYLGRSDVTKLAVGWATALITCAAGIVVSYHFDLPTGATIVCTFGVTLVISAIIGKGMRASQ